MADLEGNLLVAQSGGPTCAINASVAGVVTEAGKQSVITEIYGGLNGMLGILDESLCDLNEEKARGIEGLKYTPGAALGTCRYKLDFNQKPEQAARDMDRLFDVFKAHDIRYFFYVGGNDSQDTSHKIHLEATRRGWEMRIIGIPSTIDNDLPHTDHCPGYGSVIKYCATTVTEIGLDVGSMATNNGACCVIEVMGRSAGWIAAGTILAKRAPQDPPHIVLAPEVRYDMDAVVARIRETVQQHRYCVIVVGEGIKNKDGEEIGTNKPQVDALGHPLLSGAADRIADFVQSKLGTKTRTVKLGYAQRAAAHFASATDIAESFACGEAAVRAAVAGIGGSMVKIVRRDSQPYRWALDLQALEDIANVEHLVPRDWISEDGFLPNEKFVDYARPLVEGDLRLPLDGGLPRYVTLEKVPVEKKLPPRA